MAPSSQRRASVPARHRPIAIGNHEIGRLARHGRAPAQVERVLNSRGVALPRDVRLRMASRLGWDPASVRIHVDKRAATSARSVGANAYSVGNDVVFGPGAYRPWSTEGTRLLAHELVHTAQNAGHPGGVVHRDTATQGPITARTIFPYEQDERVTVNHLIDEFFLRMIEARNAAIGGLLRQLTARRATITIASDDVFEAVIEAEAATPERAARGSLAMRLERAGGTFDLRFFQIDDQGNRVSLPGVEGLTARRKGNAIALAGAVEGMDVEFLVRPGPKPREVRLSATSPAPLNLLAIESLGLTRAGSEQERQIVRDAAASAGSARHVPRQRLSLSGGGLWLGSDPIAPLFGVAWQMNFVPVRRFGTLAQVPIEVQLQYAPPTDVFARITSGVETSLSPIVPVNVRLVAGVGAGSAHPEATSSDPSRRLLLGPTVGGGVGYERGWFRADVRYEYLWNLLDKSPNSHALSLRLGAAF
jgi:hypothetical protein